MNATGDVVLRPPELSDTEPLHLLFRDPEVMHWIGDGRVPGHEKVQAPDPSDPGQWQVLDLNQRRQRRRFYRPLPLAARATCRTLADQRRKEYQCRTDTSNPGCERAPVKSFEAVVKGFVPCTPHFLST